MSKCVYCGLRKGKRPCPGYPPGGGDSPGRSPGLICTQCCGEYRLVRIACPADCVYLDANNDYQQRRLGDRFAQPRREFYRDLFELGGEKAAALFNLIEVVTFSYFQGRRDGQDAEVLAAVQALRRSLSPLHVPAAPMPVFAEHLKKEYEAFVAQQSPQAVESQIAPEVLDRASQFITGVSGGAFQSQRFLNALIGYIRTHHPEVAEQLARQQQQGRILLPGQLVPPPAAGPAEPPGHLHAGHAHHHR
ncbi:hypothetical protein [Nitrospira sp. Kam-Ns4a]